MAAAVVVAGAVPALAVQGASASDSPAITGGHFVIAMENGSYTVGSDSTAVGTPVITKGHPGRTWIFNAATTYFGEPAGYWQTTDGNYLAMTNDCGHATIKANPTDNGVIWEVHQIGTDGHTYLVNRYCDQNQGVGGGGEKNNGADLEAKNLSRVPWGICGGTFNCSGDFSKLMFQDPGT